MCELIQNTLLQNGVIEDSDLAEMAIEEPEKTKVLESCKSLPSKIDDVLSVATVKNHNHINNNNNISSSSIDKENDPEAVNKWLKSIGKAIYSYMYVCLYVHTYMNSSSKSFVNNSFQRRIFSNRVRVLSRYIQKASVQRYGTGQENMGSGADSGFGNTKSRTQEKNFGFRRWKTKWTDQQHGRFEGTQHSGKYLYYILLYFKFIF